jgi:hypothetical protein
MQLRDLIDQRYETRNMAREWNEGQDRLDVVRKWPNYLVDDWHEFTNLGGDLIKILFEFGLRGLESMYLLLEGLHPGSSLSHSLELFRSQLD